MTLDAGYFSDRYAASADPWGLAERWYESRKYALSLALLPRERYRAAFEPGCSIGVLSAPPRRAPARGALAAPGTRPSPHWRRSAPGPCRARRARPSGALPRC
jgi:hypothetical protein